MFAAQTGAWRGTGPRPTVKAAIKHGEGQALALREGEAFFYRSAGALGCHTRMRAGVPRHRSRARPVGGDRLKLWHICQAILTCSGSGDPELQRWPRCALPSRRINL